MTDEYVIQWEGLDGQVVRAEDQIGEHPFQPRTTYPDERTALLEMVGDMDAAIDAARSTRRTARLRLRQLERKGPCPRP